MKNRRFKDEKRKGEKGKDKRTVFASFTSIAGGRKIAYTPYSDMVLRHAKICCTTDKSPFKKELLESISDIEDIKGPVVSDFIRTLVEPIEDVCNERATVLKTGMKVKLLVKDGLTMLFQLGELKPFLPYTSLSAGEKILAIVLMTDLVNLFSGSGFLIIDDTDHLDEDSFEVLLKFVTDKDIQEQYDNIIISSVNHSDIVNKIKDYDVDHIEML